MGGYNSSVRPEKTAKRQPMSKRYVALFLVPLMLGMLFLQETAKLDVNFYLDMVGGNSAFFEMPPEERSNALNEMRKQWPLLDYYAHHKEWKLLHHLSQSQLKASKWVLAIGLILVHFGLNAAFVRIFLRALKPVKTLAAVTLAAVFVSGMLLAVGKFSGMGEAGYNVAREFLGFTQSPFPAFLIVFATLVFQRIKGGLSD